MSKAKAEEERLRQLDREWSEAYPRCDTATLDRIIADDWLCIDGAGLIITKQQLLERVAKGPSPFDTYRFDEQRVRLFGDAAVVTGRLSASGAGEDGPFRLQQRFTRVYVRREQGWQAIATQVTVLPEP
ncbi:MAG TPA: nuclear transport factor 2 family protein [Pyrinomonadaceae bacterium]